MTEPGTAGRRTYRRELAAVFLAALAVRLLYAALQPGGLPGDTDSYRAIADSVISGRGYEITPGTPTAYRPPGYPILVALVTRLGGPWAVLWVQCVLGAAAALVAAALARALVGELFALVAGLIVALDPYEIAVCGQFMTEALFLFLVTSSVALLVAALRSANIWRYAFAGLSAGAAAVTRPEFLVFLPGAIFAVTAWGQRRLRVACAMCFVAAALALPAAWGYRNSRAMGEWIFTTTHGGYTHRLAYNGIFYSDVVAGGDEAWTSDSSSLAEWQARIAAETQGMNEVAADRHNYAMAAGFTAGDPHRALTVGLYEALGFWRAYPHGRGRLATAAAGAFFVVLAALAIIGAAIAWRRGPVVPLTVYLLAAETVVHMYYWSNVRMRIPYHPLIAVAAAAAVAAFFGRKAYAGAAVAMPSGAVYGPAA